MKTQLYFFKICILCILCFSFKGHAHSSSIEHNHSPHHNPNQPKWDLIENLYEKAIVFSPEIFTIAENTTAQPYLKQGKHFIPLESGFWDLVRGWIRLYRHELETYCPCDINEEELLQKAKDHVAVGTFSSKIGQPTSRFSENIFMKSMEFSSKYGKAAVLLKISAEVAEHTLSLFVGGKGVHIFCNVIDTMILFLFRKSQIYARTFYNSKTLNKSRLLMILRMAWFNHLMKKIQKQVFFSIESADIHLPSLNIVNQEGLGKNKRAEWVDFLSREIQPALEQIDHLDKQLTMSYLSEKQKNKLLKKRRKLYEKIKHVTQVSKKSFFGKRYKRFFFFRSGKNRNNYLKGSDFTDKITSGLWPLSIQENILQRAFIQEGTNPLSSSALQLDEIRTGLAKEFINNITLPTGMKKPKGHVQAVERILMDIENIFNPSVSTIKKYLLISTLEMVLVGFFEHYLNQVYSQFNQEDVSVWQKGRLKWQISRFTYYVFTYTDFLRSVALVKNKNKTAFYKYSSMENLLLFMEYLNKLSVIAHENYTQSEIETKLSENIRRLQTFQVQKEKRTAFSWIPFRTPLPHCRNLLQRPTR